MTANLCETNVSFRIRACVVNMKTVNFVTNLTSCKEKWWQTKCCSFTFSGLEANAKSEAQSNTFTTSCCISGKSSPRLNVCLLPYKLQIYSQVFFLANVRREKHSNTTGKLSGLWKAMVNPSGLLPLQFHKPPSKRTWVEHVARSKAKLLTPDILLKDSPGRLHGKLWHNA